MGEPAGQLICTGAGVDLVLRRVFAALVAEVWADVTEPSRTARWFGPWEGDAAPGRTIRVKMVFEAETPWFELRVDACEPPRRLAVSATDEAGAWRMELLLSEVDDGTELSLVHHLDGTGGVGEIGPGWEYYLDLLAAARDAAPPVSFDDYYPAMKPYFEALVTR
ncbi:SRPBCC domain-containing protein [Amycolatopsis sp. NBC_00345]|uniref:SRPBCC domain-containing protein n=1 Tax=Amycolatopsis sp. NBC_00345 TaxID=2975955 RepID=UPI002E25F848